MNNKGHTGWQGLIGDLPLYRQLREKGEPSPLLRIAESWLRAELEAEDATPEKADGAAARIMADPLQNPTLSGGGFSAGRMAAYDFIG